MRFIPLMIVLASCGGTASKKDKVSDPIKPGISELQAKYDLYVELSKELRDEYGFTYTGCDSIGYSAGWGYGAKHSIDLGSALKQPGKYLRRPLAYGNCYEQTHPNGKRLSKSEMSRDHMVKILRYIYHSDMSQGEKRGLIQDIINYVRSNNWRLGKGQIADVLVTPQLFGTMLQMVYVLGGSDDVVRRTPYVAGGSGYAAETSALHLLLRWEMGLSVSLPWPAKKMKEQPQNPLFKTIYHRIKDRDYTAPIASLMDETHWPNDRLPSGTEHSSEWVTERDMGDDWIPDGETKPYAAGDWLTAAWIILGDK